MPETPQQRKEREHQEDLQRLRDLRPMDDDFMRSLFRHSPALVELVLRIILGKPDLQVVSFETQADMNRITGARTICLDAYATDASGKKYDIEVQRDEQGATPHRARYHASVMDIENLDQGQSFDSLPDTYTIFITERDFFRANKPLYEIQRMNLTTGTPFEDGAYILYVNGEYHDTSDLGKLMHDFNCSDPDDMQIDLLAESTRYLKESPKGVSDMCKAMELMKNQAREEGREEGRTESKIETAINFFKMGLDIDTIAQGVGYSPEIVRHWLASALSNQESAPCV